ncbi:MAG: O-sialoglycoprotein endopeptidase [Clostridia bacterium]|jgi:N6-L-threonylcarbamoyladenine synthase|nr:O-sialoglycoprotein endopeptidase [Clostridia bacterium]
MYFLGIDTSCYTSSVAIVDENENLIYDGRILLDVAINEKGLRQSDAVFQHMNHIPKLFGEAMEITDANRLKAIGVSARPRNVESSYMPVFTAGNNYAKVIAATIKAPIIECSHQQGHIIAGAWSINQTFTDMHLVYHISGGTTELLKVVDINHAIEIVGGTQDLNAGQYIDRIGVALGMKFPCGKEMDKLCNDNESSEFELPISVKAATLSFSGPESHVQRLIAKKTVLEKEFKSKISKSVFINIAEALERTIINACAIHNIKDVLIVGGVASNSIISRKLQDSAKAKKSGINITISKPEYSADNAVGAALYAKREHLDFGGNYERNNFYSKGNKQLY